MRLARSSITPTLAETIYMLIESRLTDVNICLPAKVISYDSATQFAEVQPQLQKRYETGDLVSLPVLSDVPVVHPRAFGGRAYVHLPLAKDDDVVLVFSQRSLENWKTQGGLTDPNDRRKFHISDAFAIPGGSASPDAFEVEEPEAIEIANQDAKIQIFKTGKFKIKNTSDELIDQLQQMASTLASASTIAGGPFIPSVVAQLNAIASALSGLKG